MTVNELIDKLFHYPMNKRVEVMVYYPNNEGLAEIESVEFEENSQTVIIELKN